MTNKACCDGGVPAQPSAPVITEGEIIQLRAKKMGILPAGKPLPCYEVGDGDKAIIVVYDIFGFEVPRTRQVCDQIAKSLGARVIMPDFYRGTDVLKEFGTFPPPGGLEEVVEWVTKTAPFDQTLKDLFGVVVKHLEGKGAKSFGMLGFCWGGKITMLASSDDKIKAGVGIHPSFLEPADASKAKCPQMLLPAGNDPPIQPVWDALQAKGKDFADKCFLKVFEKMGHGWSLRSDMSDPVLGPQANEAIELAIKFFNDNV